MKGMEGMGIGESRKAERLKTEPDPAAQRSAPTRRPRVVFLACPLKVPKQILAVLTPRQTKELREMKHRMLAPLASLG